MPQFPSRAPRLLPRLAAKLIDAAAVLGVTVVTAALVVGCASEGKRGTWCRGVHPRLAVIGFVAYTVTAEYHHGRTIGKRLMGIQVVSESGARISLGQSLLRQLPFFGQFFFIDALFALFTERRQRAFELLTKTRAVAILLCCVVLAA